MDMYLIEKLIIFAIHINDHSMTHIMTLLHVRYNIILGTERPNCLMCISDQNR